MSVDSGKDDPEKTLLGIKLLHLDNDIGDLDQELKGSLVQDSTCQLPATNSPFIADEERRRLETLRSSSAPPSLFFSTFDLFGNNNKVGGEDDVSLETVYEGVRPDDPRLDPAYFEYYYTQKRNDPRFPKPLLSYTDFRIASERKGKNYSKEFLNDLKEASSSEKSSLVENVTEDNPSMNNSGHAIKQPQPVIARRVPVAGAVRPSTPGTIGDRVSSKLNFNVELSNLPLNTSASSDVSLVSPSASSSWPKSVMDRIQEDFPRTPSPALSNNALRKQTVSSPRKPVERVRSFGDIACSDSLAPGSPSPPPTEQRTKQLDRSSSLDIQFHDTDTLKVAASTIESTLQTVGDQKLMQGSTSEGITNGSRVSRRVARDSLQNEHPWQVSAAAKDALMDSQTRNVPWKMHSKGMEYSSGETSGFSHGGPFPKSNIDSSQVYSRMETLDQTGFSPFIGAQDNHFVNDMNNAVPTSSYLGQPSQQLYAAQFAQFAAYNAAAAVAANTGNPPSRNAFYASPTMTGVSFPGATPLYLNPGIGIPSNNRPTREAWESHPMNNVSFPKFFGSSYSPQGHSMEKGADIKAHYNRVAADNSIGASSFYSSPSKRGGKTRKGMKSKIEQEYLPKERSNSVETKRSPLLEEFRQTCLVGRPSSNAQSVSQLYPSAFISSAPVRNWELLDIRGHIAEFASDQHGSRFIQQKLEGANLEEIRSLVAELGPDIDRLVIDVFGNYVVQKLLEHGDENIRQLLTKKLEGHMLSLSLHMYGCRVVQKALEVLKGNERTQLVQELDGHVLQCIRDQNGNHVIQKCIELVEPENIVFIVDSVKGQAVALAEHAYGCRVVQRVLEHCPKEHKAEILAEIMGCARDLIRDQYGNYVIQHIVEKGDADNKAVIMKVVLNEVVAFAQHKFASNVVERCLQYGSPVQRMDFIEVLVRGKDSAEDCPLSNLVKDQFGNYVVQRILDVANEDHLKRVVSILKEQIPYLKKYSYGKHIIAKLENLRS
ncbi:Pumilio homolog 5 [Galdieria sulphuraria]|nr:Pumilio homolog 5 [Galdieria sulphuraria]